MNMNLQLNNLRNRVAWVFIGLFFILLWLPLADSAFDLDRVPLTDEKRALATFPEYAPGVKPMREYLMGIDAYYADHFGFRNQLLRWNNRWKRRYFKESSVANVVLGKDGWLYFSGQDMAGHARGLKGFKPAELKNWQEVLEGRRDWLAQRGIKYLFIIPPDKETIYPEHLPDWIRRTGPYNKLDQLLAYMKEHSSVEILDLRPVLRAAKSTAPTYFNTDTHWNHFGGFTGYQSLIHALRRQLPDLSEPLPLSSFEMSIVPTPGMDLAQMLGQEKSLKEVNMAHLSPKPPLFELEAKGDASILPKQWEPQRIPLRTTNPANKHTMIMFRDSFAGFLIPFLGYNLKEVIYISQPEWDLKLIDREKPDVVVDEILERLFNNIDTKRLRLSTNL